MALTAKPISTVSYNTPEFLKRLLDRMFKAHTIEDYRFIKHEPEEDEEKVHFHVILFPNKRIDTALLREEFEEIDPNNEKPLGCMPFRSSKPDHWLMYVLHDPEYLKNHKSDNDGDGKIPYTLEDIVTPFEQQLRRDYKKAEQLRKTKNQQIATSLIHGETMTSTIMSADANPMQVIAMRNAIIQDATGTLAQLFTQQELQNMADLLGIPKLQTEDELKQLAPEREEGVQQKIVRYYQQDKDGKLVQTGYEFKEVEE